MTDRSGFSDSASTTLTGDMMTKEEQSIERAKSICEADGEALAKYYEENWDADKIREMAQVKDD